MKHIIFIGLALLLVGTGCRSAKQAAGALENAEMTKLEPKLIGSAVSAPNIIVYKTKADFSNQVPVIMDAKHEHIVSYPAPGDVYYKGILAKPVSLGNGYWLDNRGINEHVAFLEYTYEEYSQLAQTPSVEELESKIAERYPLTEMYDCGKRDTFKNEIAELKELVANGFSGCRKLTLPIPMNATLNE